MGMAPTPEPTDFDLEKEIEALGELSDSEQLMFLNELSKLDYLQVQLDELDAQAKLDSDFPTEGNKADKDKYKKGELGRLRDEFDKEMEDVKRLKAQLESQVSNSSEKLGNQK